MKKNNRDIYIPYPKQLYIHYANQYADEILYGGAAGGGKTYSMLFDAYIKCVKYPGIRIGIFRKTFPELQRTFINNSFYLFDSSMGRYNEKHKIWTIYTGDAVSTIQFCHCKNEKDVFLYQSAEFDIIYIDELTHFTEFQYTYLLTRLRRSMSNKTEMNPHIISATNPGGIGHGWVKRRWKLFDTNIYYKVYEPDDLIENNICIDIPKLRRVFIPAKVTDNYHIVKNDPLYVSRLLATPHSKQLLEGDWSTMEGQAFPEFSDKHVINSFNIPQEWKRYISIDYGYSNPFCALWHAIDPNTKKIYTYRELYKVKLNEIDQARLVLELSEKEKIEQVIADPSVFTSRGGGKSISTVWADVGLNVIGGNNKRIFGWQKFHDWLILDEKEEPIWYMFKDKCPNLIRTIPDMVYDMTNPEDIDTDCEDHAVDAARYFLMHIDYSFNVRKLENTKQLIHNLDPISKAEWDYVQKHIFIDRNKYKSIAKELRELES